MVVDIKVFFILSTCLKTFKSCGLVVNDRVDGKGNHEDETMEFRDIMITSVRIIGLLQYDTLWLEFDHTLLTIYNKAWNSKTDE